MVIIFTGASCPRSERGNMERYKIIVADNLRNIIQGTLTMDCDPTTQLEVLLDKLEKYIIDLERGN